MRSRGMCQHSVPLQTLNCQKIIPKKRIKTPAVSTTDGWLKLNFARCVIRQTRSSGALVRCSICNLVFVDYIYDMVVGTQFHKFHARPFLRVLYVFLMKYIGR